MDKRKAAIVALAAYLNSRGKNVNRDLCEDLASIIWVASGNTISAEVRISTSDISIVRAPYIKPKRID